jgi:DNA-binding NarL/FixJ family response regulator
LDLYWYEQAKKTYGDVRKAVDVSIDALKGIRKAYPDLPVIQYTVKPDKEIMDLAYAAGATFFLEKVPLAIAEVHSALKYIMIYLMRNK